MKKLFLFLFVAVATLTGCQDFEDAIAALDDRVNALEDMNIPTINEQAASINASIAELKAADAELKDYITTLQSTAAELQKNINTTNERIDEVQAALQSEISIAKDDIMAQLEVLKSATSNELKQVNTVIDTLKAKDAALESKIEALQTYVDAELKNAKDWASATFASLEQYNALCSEVATVKTQIEGLTNSITDLESRLEAKVTADIDVAVKGLQSELADSVKEITASYVSAIAVAKEEIAEAYTAELQGAIFTLETSMKQWVNEQLSGYYTIAQVDALIASQGAELEDKLSAQKVYLESLVSSLSQTLTSKITANADLIVALRDDLSSLEGEVAQNAAGIADNTEKISANAASIVENTKAIVTNGEKFEENKKNIEVNAALIAENKQLIANVEANMGNAGNAANTTAIANNAKAIAENAELIAENGLSINNNSAAIATNTSEIENLKEVLSTTKTDLTAAYTELINTSIATLDGKLDKSVATINARIDSEVAAINSRLEALAVRVENLESEVESIKSTINSILDEIAEIQQQIAALLPRIQSVTYIPKYSDGKATMDYGTKEAELDFMISPKSAVTELAKLWNSALSVKAIYTQTRAVDFIDLPVTGFEADSDNGVISLTVSGANLNENFYVEQQDASLVLQISDGNSNISSEYVTMTPNFNIQFEDIHAKAMCVRKWDTNYDGELSYAEAAVVTEFSVYYELKTNLYAFPEFKYFIGVTEISSSCFAGCTLLSKIELPKSIVTIGEKAFRDCSNLKRIVLPEGLKTIGEYAFWNCGLREVILPNSLTILPDFLFYDCSKLTSLTIPENITQIGSMIFGEDVDRIIDIYCKPTTPPAIYYSTINTSYSAFSTSFRIYVPRASYEAYTQYSDSKQGYFQQNWARYKSQIEPYDF